MSRSLRASSCALLLAALLACAHAPAAPAAGLGGSGALSELTKSSESEEATETTTTATTASSEPTNSSSLLFIGGGVALVLLIGIVYVIMRDVRKVAPATDRRAARQRLLAPLRGGHAQTARQSQGRAPAAQAQPLSGKPRRRDVYDARRRRAQGRMCSGEVRVRGVPLRTRGGEDGEGEPWGSRRGLGGRGERGWGSIGPAGRALEPPSSSEESGMSGATAAGSLRNGIHNIRPASGIFTSAARNRIHTHSGISSPMVLLQYEVAKGH